MTRWKKLMLSVVAVASLSSTAYLAAIAWLGHAAGAVRFDPLIASFDTPLQPRAKYAMPAAVRNDTRRVVTVLGAPSYCGETGCVQVQGLPLKIPPGQIGWITIQYEAAGPGRFDNEVTIYTDHPGQVEVVLHLVGDVQDTASSSGDPASLPKIGTITSGTEK